MKLKQ